MIKILKAIGWVIVVLLGAYFLVSVGGSHAEKAIKKEMEELRNKNDSITKVVRKANYEKLSAIQFAKEAHRRADSLESDRATIIIERNKTVRSRERRIRELSGILKDKIYETWINEYRESKNHPDLIDLERIISSSGQN